MPLTAHEEDTKVHLDQTLSRYQQSAAPLAEILSPGEDISTQRAQNWSGVSSTSGSSMFVGQAVSSNPGTQSWSRPDETTMHGQVSQDSSKGYPVRYGLSTAEDSGVASFSPTNVERQFFW